MIQPGTKVPGLTLDLTIGAKYDLSKQTPENFTLVLMYRGKHCPICKKQLTELGSKLDKFTQRGINCVAVSMDSKDRAMVTDEEWDTGDLPIAYGMTENMARDWGLYISKGREDSDEPAMFSEPGMFLVRPDGELYYANTQNSPFARPPFDELLEGIDYVLKNDYPTRGTLT